VASTTPSPTATGSSSGGGIPLRPYEKMIIAHAIFCVVGFLFFLPAGALLARYLRTFVPGPIWFKTHAIFQFFIGGL
jgi:Na+/phosphate symporter